MKTQLVNYCREVCRFLKKVFLGVRKGAVWETHHISDPTTLLVPLGPVPSPGSKNLCHIFYRQVPILLSGKTGILRTVLLWSHICRCDLPINSTYSDIKNNIESQEQQDLITVDWPPRFAGPKSAVRRYHWSFLHRQIVKFMSILRVKDTSKEFNFISSSVSLAAVMIWHVIYYLLKNRRHSLPESNSSKFLSHRMIFSSATMKEVMSFKARGKGGFFFGKESKVKK